MNCSEAEVLIHALIDGELDASHAREVETHVASCTACAQTLRAHRAMRAAMAAAAPRDPAPAALRRRLEAALAPTSASMVAPRKSLNASRRMFFAGFAAGTALSAAIAASLVLTVLRDDPEQTIASEVVSAHIRSLQAGHLTDVEASDQHTVKPWFNGKVDVAPPVVDLTARGFTLLGGRLDYIGGETVAAIVYRRRQHVINLFVAPNLRAERRDQAGAPRHGFNVRHWTEGGLDFWVVSDINSGELDEFCEKFKSAVHSPA
jgi:anti-sigma factor RsiW